MSSALGPEFALEAPAQKPEPPTAESSEAPREVTAAPTADAGSAAPRDGGYASTPAYVAGQYVQPAEAAAAPSSAGAPAPGGSPYELSSASLQGTVRPQAAAPAPAASPYAATLASVGGGSPVEPAPAPEPGGSPYELSSASLQGTVRPQGGPAGTAPDQSASVYARYSVPIPLPAAQAAPAAPATEYANAAAAASMGGGQAAGLAPPSVYDANSVPIPLRAAPAAPAVPPTEYANAATAASMGGAQAAGSAPPWVYDPYSVPIALPASRRTQYANAAAPASAGEGPAAGPLPADASAPYRTKALQLPAERAEYEQEKLRTGGAVVGPQMKWRGGRDPLAQKRVRYISSEAERKAYELQVGEDGKFYWGGKVFETEQINDLRIVGGVGQAQAQGAIFVMTANGTLYMANQAKEVEGQYHFHHSSFLAGEPVAAAGVLKFTEVDGQVALSEISDLSGHYMPDVVHMRQVLTEFGKRGVSLAGVVLSGWHFRPPIDAMLVAQYPDKSIEELQRMAAVARAAVPSGSPPSS